MKIIKRIILNKMLKKYYNNMYNNLKIKEKIYKKFGTDKKCPHCGKQLIESDLKDYEYLCINCDENFYKIEVE